MSIRPQTTLFGLAVVAMVLFSGPIHGEDKKQNPRYQNRSSQDNQHSGKSGRYGEQLNRLKEQNQRPSSNTRTQSSSSQNRSSSVSNNSQSSRSTSNVAPGGRSSRPAATPSSNRRTDTSSSATYSGNRGSTSSRVTTPTVNRVTRSTGNSSSSRGSRQTPAAGSNSGVNRLPTTTYSGNRGGNDSRIMTPTVNRGGVSATTNRDQRGTTSTLDRAGISQGSRSGNFNRGGSSNGDSNRDSRSGYPRDGDRSGRGGDHRDDDRRDRDDKRDEHDKDYRHSNYDRYNSPYRRYGSSGYNSYFNRRYSSRYSSPSIHTSIILGAAALSGGSRVLSAERREDSIGYAVFYEHGSFRGESLEVYSGESVFNLKDIPIDHSKTFNDRISSIKVYGRLTVVLHIDAGYTGDRIYVHGDIIDFGRISELRGFNDCISSIEVIPGIIDEHNYSPVRGSEYAIYGDPNVSVVASQEPVPSSGYGSPAEVRAADMPLSAPLPVQANPRGVSPRVHLFDRPGFRGNQIVLTPGYSEVDLSQINKGLAGNWNDGIASIQVEGGAEVIVYTDPQFSGQAIALVDSVEDLSTDRDLIPFYGTISSVVVNGAP